MICKKLTNTTNKLGRVWTFGLALFCGCGVPASLHCCCFNFFADAGSRSIVFLSIWNLESLNHWNPMQHWLLWSVLWLSGFHLGLALCAPFRSFFCNVLPVLQRSSVQKALDAFSMGCMWANFGKRWRMQALQCDAGGRPAEAYGVHWMAYVVYRRTSLSIQLQCPCEACSCHASRRQATASWWVPQQCWDSAPMRRENHRAALHDFGPGVLPGVT